MFDLFIILIIVIVIVIIARCHRDYNCDSDSHYIITICIIAFASNFTIILKTITIKIVTVYNCPLQIANEELDGKPANVR